MESSGSFKNAMATGGNLWTFYIYFDGNFIFSMTEHSNHPDNLWANRLWLVKKLAINSANPCGVWRKASRNWTSFSFNKFKAYSVQTSLAIYILMIVYFTPRPWGKGDLISTLIVTCQTNAERCLYQCLLSFIRQPNGWFHQRLWPHIRQREGWLFPCLWLEVRCPKQYLLITPHGHKSFLFQRSSCNAR